MLAVGHHMQATAAINSELDKLEVVLISATTPRHSSGHPQDSSGALAASSTAPLAQAPMQPAATEAGSLRGSTTSIRGSLACPGSPDTAAAAVASRKSIGSVTWAAQSRAGAPESRAHSPPRALQPAVGHAAGGAAAGGGGKSGSGRLGGGAAGLDASGEPEAAGTSPLTQCRIILESLASLRGLLLRQAQTLDFLRWGTCLTAVDDSVTAS